VYILIDIHCKACGCTYEYLADKSIQEEIQFDTLRTCTQCGKLAAKREVTCCSVRTPNNCTSWLDGTPRNGIAAKKQAIDLETEMYNRPVSERSEYQREINRLRTTPHKGVTGD